MTGILPISEMFILKIKIPEMEKKINAVSGVVFIATNFLPKSTLGLLFIITYIRA